MYEEMKELEKEWNIGDC